ncbi:MAG: methyltransferase domain-containing protein, partial [Acidobacteria bacterium]|nr:methyltransferase domain-containing protein [Acidobacteriota bacterium]
MAHIDFLGEVHRSTRRDYLARVLAGNKADFAALAKKFDVEYWDGDRNTGYGGYHYDGRWRVVAQAFADHYRLRAGDRILDVGCGKGFLLYEFTQVVPGVEVQGIDISRYALEHAKEEVRARLQHGNAVELPYADRA